MSGLSPLTAALDFNGFSLQNLATGSVGTPGLYFSGDSNTGLYRPAADVVGLAAGGVDSLRALAVASGVNYHQFTPSATGNPVLWDAAGSDANIGITAQTKGTGAMILGSAGAGNVTVRAGGVANVILRANSVDMLTVTSSTSVDMGTNIPLVPAAVSGTPAQHGLFRENVPKGWLNCDVAGTINDSFNVASITDTAVGRVTVTWDRDFANANYVVEGITINSSANARDISAVSLAVGSVIIESVVHGTGLTDPTVGYAIAAHGDQ